MAVTRAVLAVVKHLGAIAKSRFDKQPKNDQVDLVHKSRPVMPWTLFRARLVTCNGNEDGTLLPRPVLKFVREALAEGTGHLPSFFSRAARSPTPTGHSCSASLRMGTVKSAMCFPMLLQCDNFIRSGVISLMGLRDAAHVH